MLSRYIFLLLLLTLGLHATIVLKNDYYIDSKNIYISTIVKDAPRNKIIYKIQKNRYTKRVKSKELIQILKENGYRDVVSKSRYVKFTKKSLIDSSKIAEFIKDYYLDKYESIDIKKLQVEPRSYMTSMPSEYSIDIRKKNFLSKNGIVSIKTPKNRKIFFNYTLDATLDVYISRKKIKKSVELSTLNLIKKSIILQKFMAKPIQNLKAHNLEAKRHIKKEMIVTSRDVQTITLVKKKTSISVSLNSNGMSINFSALALQNGRLNDIIRVKNSNAKILKVRVVGKNRAEMR